MAQDFVTVFRSADESAAEDAAAVRDLLADTGLAAILRDDNQPGVPEGAWEVCVPAESEMAALAAIAQSKQAQPAPDDSHSMDLETIFEGVGATGELDAIGIQTVLQASNIPVTIVGSPQIPNLSFLVKVPAAMAATARAALAEAQQSGPAAAEEAEQATEPQV